MEFNVKIDMGDVYINGKFINQLQWNAEAVGYTVAEWLVNNGYPTCEDFDIWKKGNNNDCEAE